MIKMVLSLIFLLTIGWLEMPDTHSASEEEEPIEANGGRDAFDEALDEWLEAYLKEAAGPPLLCIDDGIDAEAVAYLKSLDDDNPDLIFMETDKEGRLLYYAFSSEKGEPSLNEVLGHVSSLKYLRRVELWEVHSNPPEELLNDDGFQALAGWKQLEQLEVDTLALTSTAFQRLTRINPLSQLRLLSVELASDGDGLGCAIENCRQLEELCIGCPRLSDKFVSRLAKLTKLKSLVIFESQITGIGFRDLEKLQGFEKLSVKGPVTDEGLSYICRFHKLRELYLDKCVVTDVGVAALSKLGYLESLSLSGSRITAAGLEPLTQIEYLDTLFLEETALGDESIPTLSKLQNLELLYIGGTEISRQGVRRLQKALANCRIRHSF